MVVSAVSTTNSSSSHPKGGKDVSFPEACCSLRCRHRNYQIRKRECLRNRCVLSCSNKKRLHPFPKFLLVIRAGFK